MNLSSRINWKYKSGTTTINSQPGSFKVTRQWMEIERRIGEGNLQLFSHALGELICIRSRVAIFWCLVFWWRDFRQNCVPHGIMEQCPLRLKGRCHGEASFGSTKSVHTDLKYSICLLFILNWFVFFGFCSKMTPPWHPNEHNFVQLLQATSGF